AVTAPYRSGNPQGDKVSLAINVDWGNEYLPTMLQTLAEQQVKATFFLTGRWTAANNELAQNIAVDGHELGNHGYSHKSPNDSTVAEILDEISRTEQAIYQATGVITTLYAPPSGESETHVLEAADKAGYQTILWSVDTIDWQKPDVDTIVARVEKKLAPGAIILAHPTASTASAMPQIIDLIREKGLHLVPVSENIAP
ncbi:MAG: polysaccharide deacetylase family protein, partial [Clostridiales bacterium]